MHKNINKLKKYLLFPKINEVPIEKYVFYICIVYNMVLALLRVFRQLCNSYNF